MIAIVILIVIVIVLVIGMTWIIIIPGGYISNVFDNSGTISPWFQELILLTVDLLLICQFLVVLLPFRNSTYHVVEKLTSHLLGSTFLGGRRIQP